MPRYLSSEAQRIYDQAEKDSARALRDGEFEANKIRSTIATETTSMTLKLNSEIQALSNDSVRRKDLYAKDYDRIITNTRNDYSGRMNLVERQTDLSLEQKQLRRRDLEQTLSNVLRDLENKKRAQLTLIDNELQNSINTRKKGFTETKFAVESRIKAEAERVLSYARNSADKILSEGRSRAEREESQWRAGHMR